MNREHLVTMANDIAAFFAAEPDRAAAAASVAQHLVRFWEPRMRREIIAYQQTGGNGLSPLAADAVQLLVPSGQNRP